MAAIPTYGNRAEVTLGRPSKLDDLTAQRIVAAVEKGLPRVTAAKLARVHPATLYEWLARGRDGDADYVEFADRVRQAESKGEEALVGVMVQHAANHWQACAWLLERRHAKAWAKADAVAAGATKPLATSPEERVSLLESMLAAERSAAG